MLRSESRRVPEPAPGFPRPSGASYNNITTNRNPANRGDWIEKKWVPAYQHSHIARTEPTSVRFWKSIFSLGNPDFRRRDPRPPWVVYLQMPPPPCIFSRFAFFRVKILVKIPFPLWQIRKIARFAGRGGATSGTAGAIFRICQRGNGIFTRIFTRKKAKLEKMQGGGGICKYTTHGGRGSRRRKSRFLSQKMDFQKCGRGHSVRAIGLCGYAGIHFFSLQSPRLDGSRLVVILL